MFRGLSATPGMEGRDWPCSRQAHYPYTPIYFSLYSGIAFHLYTHKCINVSHFLSVQSATGRCFRILFTINDAAINTGININILAVVLLGLKLRCYASRVCLLLLNTSLTLTSDVNVSIFFKQIK